MVVELEEHRKIQKSSGRQPQSAEANNPHPPTDWQKLYQERATRLKRLIELNAPQYIVAMTARSLLATEFHNSKWRMVWRWLLDDIRKQIYFWKFDIRVLYLRSRGWSRSCAIDILSGDSESNHKKGGCTCTEDAWVEAAARAEDGQDRKPEGQS